MVGAHSQLGCSHRLVFALSRKPFGIKALEKRIRGFSSNFPLLDQDRAASGIEKCPQQTQQIVAIRLYLDGRLDPAKREDASIPLCRIDVLDAKHPAGNVDYG